VARYTYMVDNDLGDLFFNFPLDQKLRPYAGLDLGHFLDMLEDGSSTQVWAQWDCCCLMGFKPLPYNAIKLMLWAEDMVRGDWLDPGNPFCLDKVVENLPGTPSYDPSMPWVYKVMVFEDGT
jgi:hypothetical protein